MMKKNAYIFLLLAAGIIATCFFLRNQVDDTSVGVVENETPSPLVTDHVSGSESAAAVDQRAVESIHGMNGSSKESSRFGSVLNEQAPYKTRLRELHTINFESLSEDEAKVIRDFLLSELKSDDAQHDARLAIRNDLLEKLMANPDVAHVAADVLIAGVQDKGQDPLWREYLLQHYSVFVDDYYDRELVTKDVFSTLEETLTSCLEERYSAIAGTALLNFSRLSEGGSGMGQGHDWVVEAKQIAYDQDAHLASRISAFQTIPTEASEMSEDVMVEFMDNAETHLLLKLAFLNYVKRSSGVSSDEYSHLLANFKNSNNKHVVRLLNE